MRARARRISWRKRGLASAEWVILSTVVFSVLASLGFLITGALGGRKYAKIEDDLALLETALAQYARNNFSRPPTQEQGLEALLEKPSLDPQPERWQAPYLEELPVDPWGSAYQYRLPAERSRLSYDLFSLGRKKKDPRDDIGNW